MRLTVLTLFPEIIDAYFASSIIAKAVKKEIIGYRAVNIRDFALDKHKTCDDAPYGGGAGMLMLAEPLSRALEFAGAKKKLPVKAGSRDNSESRSDKILTHVIYLSPAGRLFNQKRAQELSELAKTTELIFICGRYEGIDQRIIDLYADEELSVGDYVLSSGEAAALVLIDAVYRLADRVLRPESLTEESFSGGLLEYPQYTRPEVFDTMKVPEVLLSGHHEHIRRWRLKKRVEKTLAVRPELVKKGLEENLFNGETVKTIDEVRNNNERNSCD